jgi:hypothetical protein
VMASRALHRSTFNFTDAPKGRPTPHSGRA